MTDKTPLLADDEIKALAREAGCLVVTDRYGTMTFQAYGDNLRKFVALVAERAAAAEREWIVEKAESSLNSLDETCSWAAAGYAQGIRDFVAAIRARGEA